MVITNSTKITNNTNMLLNSIHIVSNKPSMMMIYISSIVIQVLVAVLHLLYRSNRLRVSIIYICWKRIKQIQVKPVRTCLTVL